MPLMSFWRDKPDEVRTMSVDRIVNLAGNGELTDRSECSAEFRAFLTEVEATDLARFVTECLERGEGGLRKSRRGFNNSGYVLQDLVNEIGRRLDYTVDDGIYAGRTGTIGYDGIWRDGSGAALIIEVKTTDAYSIALDTVDGYRRRLVVDGVVEEGSSVLFVVGRDDTGALEAQIRGSPHAWTMRMIGAASLVRLLHVKVNAEAPNVVDRIRSVLRPIEYTRVDRIVDLLFDVRADADEAEDAPRDGTEVATPARPARRPSSAPSTDIDAFRAEVASAVAKAAGTHLTKRRRSWFESPDGVTRAVVAISKRYQRDYQSYWYGVYDTQRSFFCDSERGYLALCALDSGRVWLLPAEEFEKRVNEMNSTVRPDGQTYWHVITKLSGDTCLLVTQAGQFDLTPFEINLLAGPSSTS